MAKLLEGQIPAATILEEVAGKIKNLPPAAKRPKFAMVQVGNDEESGFYARSLIKAATFCGINYEMIHFSEDVAKGDLLAALKILGDRRDVHGILPLLPFSIPYYKAWEGEIRNSIAAEKDVDCVSQGNAAKLYLGDFGSFLPATAQAVMDLLKFYKIPLVGESVVIIGRSLVVGKPLAMLLLEAKATVTLCHSHTLDLAAITRKAKVVISAVGRPEMLTETFFSRGQTVVNVGLTKKGDIYCGDVDFDKVQKLVAYITPNCGGVGPVTTALLMQHIYAAYEQLQ